MKRKGRREVRKGIEEKEEEEKGGEKRRGVDSLSKRVWKKEKGREKRRIKEARQGKRIAAAYSH